MYVRVDRHIYGSSKGYKTLAHSPGLAIEDLEQMEEIRFGQTNNRAWLESLWPKPAYLLRLFKSGRFAVTRVLPGKPDDYNRATLMFSSAVIEPEQWLGQLQCDIDYILFCKDLWKWDGRETIPRGVVEVNEQIYKPSDQTRDRTISLLRAVEAYRHDKIKIITEESEFDYTAFRYLNMLLPYSARKEFTCATRTLNGEPDVQILSLTTGANISDTAGLCLEWQSNSKPPAKTPYTDALEKMWLRGQQPPLEYARKSQTFTKSQMPDQASSIDPTATVKRILRKAQAGSAQKQAKKRKKIPRPVIAAVIAALMIAIVVIGIFSALHIRMKMKVNELTEQADTFLTENSLVNAYAAQTPVEPLIDRAGKLYQQAEVLRKSSSYPEIKTLSAELGQYIRQARAAEEQLSDVTALLKDLGELELSAEITEYPQPEKVRAADTIYDKLLAHQSAFVLPSPDYISRVQQAIAAISAWSRQISKVLDAEIQPLENFAQNIADANQPQYFSSEQYSQYQNKLQQFKKITAQITSLKNALNSPHKTDAITAQKTLDKIGEIENELLTRIQTLETYQQAAQVNIGHATTLINQADLERQSLDRDVIAQARKYLEDAARYWPDNSVLENLRDRLTNIIARKLLAKYENTLADIDLLISTTDANSYTDEKYAKLLEQAEAIEPLENDLKELDVTGLEKLAAQRDALLERLTGQQAVIEKKLQKLELLQSDFGKEVEQLTAVIETLQKADPSRGTTPMLKKRYQQYLLAEQKLEKLEQTWPRNTEIDMLRLNLAKWRLANEGLISLIGYHDWFLRLEKTLAAGSEFDKQAWKKEYERKVNDFQNLLQSLDTDYPALTNDIKELISKLSSDFTGQS